MDQHAIAALLLEQSGVISRRQVLASKGADNDIEGMIRRREWTAVLQGVYVNHTGPLSWLQRAWVAILFYWPAALSHQSALQIHGLRTVGDDDGLIHVAVNSGRRVSAQTGIRVHRMSHLSDRVQPNRGPARIRLEHALLDVASRTASDDAAVAVLSDACQARRTTPARLLVALEQRPRLPRRSFLGRVLEDVAEGAYSVLERRYLLRVERPHGLPTAKRQRRVAQGRTSAYRDVEYVGLRTVVELDGRLGHEEAQDRWDDLDRDVDSAVDGDITVRISWRHVQDQCRTAIAVGRILHARGWPGRVQPCDPACPVNRLVGDLPA